ncbi:hypothetical protein T265_15343, partial [Opisthorchis viverrini]
LGCVVWLLVCSPSLAVGLQTSHHQSRWHRPCMVEWVNSSSSALGCFGCWSAHRAWQLDCKRLITNRGGIVRACMSGDPGFPIGVELHTIDSASMKCLKSGHIRSCFCGVPKHSAAFSKLIDLFGCWSVRRAWQLDCKRFITNRGDIVSAGLSG